MTIILLDSEGSGST